MSQLKASKGKKSKKSKKAKKANKGKGRKPLAQRPDPFAFEKQLDTRFEDAMATVGCGYTWEELTVDTQDGYELTLQVITADETGVAELRPNGPVLLMHGLATDSLDWFNVETEDECALGTRLFENGYQVYFGNVRGTPKSRTFSNGMDALSNESSYWNFSLEEIGDYDLQAMVKAAY